MNCQRGWVQVVRRKQAFNQRESAAVTCRRCFDEPFWFAGIEVQFLAALTVHVHIFGV